MSTSRAVRAAKFAQFVRAAVENARIQRGWTVREVLAATGVGKTTLYRWINAEWTEDPLSSKVRDFCQGLDLDAERAFRILWPTEGERPAQPEPITDPDIVALLRKLQDPNVNDETKNYIRTTLQMLANMPVQPRKRRAG